MPGGAGPFWSNVPLPRWKGRTIVPQNYISQTPSVNYAFITKLLGYAVEGSAPAALTTTKFLGYGVEGSSPIALSVTKLLGYAVLVYVPFPTFLWPNPRINLPRIVERGMVSQKSTALVDAVVPFTQTVLPTPTSARRFLDSPTINKIPDAVVAATPFFVSLLPDIREVKRRFMEHFTVQRMFSPPPPASTPHFAYLLLAST